MASHSEVLIPARRAVASSGRQLFSRAFLIKMPNNWAQTLRVVSWNLFWLRIYMLIYTLLLMNAPCQANSGRAD
jgi:hypothetical protein